MSISDLFEITSDDDGDYVVRDAYTHKVLAVRTSYAAALAVALAMLAERSRGGEAA